MDGQHEAPQIYLVAEVGPTLAERLTAALEAVPLATVLLLPPAGATLAAAEVKPLVEAIQAKGVAALLADDAALARTVRADGVHLSAGLDVQARFEEAREILGTRYIVGVEVAAPTVADGEADVRHQAMTLGEAGAEYVAFSEAASLAPGENGTGGQSEAQPGDALLDLIDWWSEIFEVPCVGFVASTPAEAVHLAEAGAEFVAVRLPRAASPADVRDHVRAVAAALSTDVTEPA